MFSTAEKSTRRSTVLQNNAVATAFLHRKAEGNFLEQKQDHTFIQPKETAATITFIQPKLSISLPNDPQEKQADEVAEKVMRMPEPASLPATASEENEKILPKLEEEEEEKIQTKAGVSVQRKCAECEEEERIQTKLVNASTFRRAGAESLARGNLRSAADAKPSINAVPEIATFNLPLQDRAPPGASTTFEQHLYRTKGAGNPLPGTLLHFLENRLSVDLSRVRIHTGATAVLLSKEIHAQAFTHGTDVYFNAGKYAPHTSEGFFLLAHELVHVIQQKGAKLKVTENNNYKKPFSNRRFAGIQPQAFTTSQPLTKIIPVESAKSIAELEKSLKPGAVPIPKRPAESITAPEKEPDVIPVPGKAKEAEAAAKEISRAPKTPKQDPDFQQAKKQIRKESFRQKRHDSSGQKREEAVKASALEEEEQKQQSAKENNTKEMEAVGATQRQEGQKFSAEKFKEDLLKRINAKQPESESEAKSFAENAPIEHFEEEFSGNVAKEQSHITKPLEQKAAPNPSGGTIEKPIAEIPDPKRIPAPKPVDAKLAAPKARTDEEISFEHESDRVDAAMKQNDLTDEQLSESREPSFIETLRVKQEAKQKAAEAPGVYRKQEAEMLQNSEVQSHQLLTTELASMNSKNRKTGSTIFNNQQSSETKTEKRQKEIKEKIDTIYSNTVSSVKCILESMACKVKEDFSNALKAQTEEFNSEVRRRISNYYGDWRIDDKLFGPADVVVLPDGSTRRMTLEESMGLVEAKKINPDVYKIFVQEKNKFLEAMNKELDKIATQIQEGLTAAHNRINAGKLEIAAFKTTLTVDELTYANQLEQEVLLKFENLESSIDDTREDLLQTLAEQYTENVNQLEKTFNEINDELKKSWIDRAIEFITTVGKTIYQLADLLFSILKRVAYLVWDIIKHPIRFFETLVSGLMQGISKFIDNISTYLQEAFWTWITGASPVKNIRLTIGSGVESLFNLVVQVLSLGPAQLRAIAEKVLGKKFMQFIDKGMAAGEKVLEPVLILLSKGPLQFWHYIKDTLTSIIQSSFDRIKETVFYAFIEKGLKWIAGFFVPGGGFVKIVKAIFRAFQFVAENLENIWHFFDAVFDSMEAAVAGHTEGVVSKIITGLKAGVVLALDFLAKLLGLNKIVEQVQKIIQSLGKPIVAAIEWVLLKIKPFAVKLMELRKKGAAWVKGKAKKATQKVASWLGLRKSFVTKAGEKHTMYVKASIKSVSLMIATKPMQLSQFFIHTESELKQSTVLDAAEKSRKISRISHGKNLLQGLQAIMNSARRSNQNDQRIPGMVMELIHIVREVGTGRTQQVVPQAAFDPGFIDAKANTFSARFVYKGGGSVPKNHAEGTSPSESNLAETWQILKDKQLSSRWVRFHILNEKLGGIAADSNLIPTPSYINNEYRAVLEDDLKRYYRSGIPIWLRANVRYRSIYNYLFVDTYSAQAGGMKLENETWVEDSTKQRKFSRQIDAPVNNIFNINRVISDTSDETLLVNMSTVTRGMVDILRRNQPQGGFTYYRQMERVLASAALGRDVLSFDPEVVNKFSPTQAQKTKIDSYRKGLSSVDWTF